MLGESNQRNKMEIFRELDNGMVSMHMTLCLTIFTG